MIRSAAKSRRSRHDKIVEVVETLHRIFKAVDTFSRWALKEFGITGPQIWALRTIESQGNPTVSELAGEMYLHISTVSGILDRLEDESLITRKRMVSDRRVVHLALTPQGRAVLRRAPEPPRSKVPRGIQRLSPKDLGSLIQAMRHLARIMQVEDIERRLAKD